MLGLRCCMQAFSSCGKRGQLFVAVYRLLAAVASGVMEHRLSCSTACGIFPDQGLSPWPLHWQPDSYALYHQGNPRVVPSYLLQSGFIAYPRGYIRILSLFCSSNYFIKTLGAPSGWPHPCSHPQMCDKGCCASHRLKPVCSRRAQGTRLRTSAPC